MNIATIALQRHSCKAFDALKKIPAPLFSQLLDAARYSASSVNSQPWHFHVAHSDEAKARIARATEPHFSVNTPKILHASHVMVLSARLDLDETYLQQLLAQETADGRLKDAAAREKQDATRRYYLGLHKRAGDTAQWTRRQVYLALGTVLFAASAAGIDACPIEGFDNAVLDTELDLPATGYASLALVALGYRSDADFNAALPKSRLPAADVVTWL